MSLGTQCIAADDEAGDKERRRAVFVIEAKSDTGGGAGTGFACVFKGREFVATNLHVLEGANTVEVKPQSGDHIALSGRIVAAEDADICLMGIKGTFADLGIKPLEFMENVFEGSKAGDEIQCFGNSLGNGVITATNGTVKAFGQPQIEIECPVVKGNSGGPIIHRKSGKVLGLVTLAIVNKMTFDELSEAASKVKESPVKDISYFGHRIDTAKKWSAATWADFTKASKEIDMASTGLMRAAYFLVDKTGWEEDRRISEAWDTYSKFIENAKEKTTKRTEKTTTVHVNQYGIVVRHDTRVKGHGVAEADYDKARATFCRAIEWKILADQEILKKSKPVGYRQAEARKLCMDFSQKVLVLQKDL